MAGLCGGWLPGVGSFPGGVVLGGGAGCWWPCWWCCGVEIGRGYRAKPCGLACARPVPVYSHPMKTQTTIKPLTRKQAREALETMPLDSLLGSGVSRELTGKQKAFARAVAMGETGAGAYRKAYSAKAKPKTAGDAAHRLKGHSGIAAEIEALKLAQAAAEYRTPAALRALVIQTLCEVVTDPLQKGAVRVNAAKVLGTVTEVAAFTERKEVRTITSSDDTRARIMAELKTLMLNTGDAVDIEALSLLDELQSPVGSAESRDYIEGDNPEVLDQDDAGHDDDDAAHDAAHDDAQFWQDSDPTPPPPSPLGPSLAR